MSVDTASLGTKYHKGAQAFSHPSIATQNCQSPEIKHYTGIQTKITKTYQLVPVQ